MEDLRNYALLEQDGNQTWRLVSDRNFRIRVGVAPGRLPKVVEVVVRSMETERIAYTATASIASSADAWISAKHSWDIPPGELAAGRYRFDVSTSDSSFSGSAPLLVRRGTTSSTRSAFDRGSSFPRVTTKNTTVRTGTHQVSGPAGFASPTGELSERNQ